MHYKNPKFKNKHWQVGDQKTATTKRFVEVREGATSNEQQES